MQFHSLSDERLGRLLLARGDLTEEQLALAREEQQKTGLPLWRVLLSLLFISPQRMTEILQRAVHLPDRQLQDRLLREALVHSDQGSEMQLEAWSAAAKTAGLPLAEWLVEQGHFTAEELARILARYLRLPYIDLDRLTVGEEVWSLLPAHLMREQEIIPLQDNGEEVLLGASIPPDEAVLDYIGFLTGRQPRVAIVARDKLQQLFRQWERMIAPWSPSLPPQRVGEERRVPILWQRPPEDLSVVQLVSSIIEGAVQVRATDIHLEPQALEMRVRYRIDGMLYDVMAIPLSLQPAVISRVKVLAEMDITERRVPQDGRMSMTIQGNEYHMRIATLPTKRGEKLVIRILTETNVFKGLKQIGLDERETVLVKRLIARPYGMILVTGPIGSGKTTTLYAMLNELDILTNNIVTIEDPVEYLLTGINQVEVDPKAGITFASGLRSMLRQDADILMVGEIRDNETARIAVRAALTGQQVFSTLHTVDTPSAITTLRNFDIQSFLIASALNGVVAQRLVRKICPYCKEGYSPSQAILRQLGLADDGAYTFFVGRGCEACYYTGYLGRTGVFEILVIDKTIKELITNQASEDEIKETAIKEGMRTLHQSGVQKVIDGITTPEEVMREIFL
ncbi:MAG: type II/IV secretion system protein [Nitrospinota bacterium]|nr:MAG: type II/IV secretion system protein [Nitrospinota bacterium]